MRKLLTIATVALVLAAPASAMAFPHFGGGHGGGFGGGHFGGHGGGFGGHGFHHGWGWGAAGLGVGLGVLAIGEASCYRDRPIYDEDGEVVGSRTVNVCF